MTSRSAARVDGPAMTWGRSLTVTRDSVADAGRRNPLLELSKRRDVGAGRGSDRAGRAGDGRYSRRMKARIWSRTSPALRRASWSLRARHLARARIGQHRETQESPLNVRMIFGKGRRQDPKRAPVQPFRFREAVRGLQHSGQVVEVPAHVRVIRT